MLLKISSKSSLFSYLLLIMSIINYCFCNIIELKINLSAARLTDCLLWAWPLYIPLCIHTSRTHQIKPLFFSIAWTTSKGLFIQHNKTINQLKYLHKLIYSNQMHRSMLNALNFKLIALSIDISRNASCGSFAYRSPIPETCILQHLIDKWLFYLK